MAAEAFVHSQVGGNFDHSLLSGLDMSWKGAARFGCEELPEALQHLKDLSNLGKELVSLCALKMQICKG